ncbi:MAG TPA: hypothetical protein VHY35_06210 [Stellaceae bacterium]|jgi:hypothetical protein|nr:hypothetical protein [Stellaceae bacterium]
MPPNEPYQRRRYVPPEYLRPSVTSSPNPAQSGASPLSEQPLTPNTPSYDHVPIQRHSRIVLLDFLRDRIAPPTPPTFPDIEGIDWRFDDFERSDDNEVRLYLYLSPEYVGKTQYFGIEHEVFEKEPVADEVTLQRIEETMQHEIAAAPSPHYRAALELEHEEMRRWLSGQTMGLTIANYRAFPFRRNFPDRLRAMLGRQKLNKIMSDLKKKLDDVKR